MNPPIKQIRASKRQIKSWDRGDTLAYALFNPNTGQHSVVLPHRVSTKTRLHEIAHCELGHCIENYRRNRMPIDLYVQQEIDADEWAFKKCGKVITLEVLFNLANDLIVELKCDFHFVFSAIIKALTKHNYTLSREQRSELWWQCREFDEEKRGY